MVLVGIAWALAWGLVSTRTFWGWVLGVVFFLIGISLFGYVVGLW